MAAVTARRSCSSREQDIPVPPILTEIAVQVRLQAVSFSFRTAASREPVRISADRFRGGESDGVGEQIRAKTLR